MCRWIYALVFSFSLIAHAGADQIFFDDFNGVTLDPRWSHSRFKGSVSVSNGELVLEPNASSLGGVIAEDFILGPTSIRTQVRLNATATSGDLIAVAARRHDDAKNETYYAGINAVGYAFISREPGTTYVGKSLGINPVDADLSLQFDAMDDKLELWVWQGDTMPSEPQLTWTFTNYETGIVGLFVSQNDSQEPLSGSFRFVHLANAHIPEPSTAVLLCLGLVSLLAWRRKKKQLSRV